VTAVLTFDTTHHALWAEELAREQQLGAQVIPAPAGSKAKCSLALEVLDEDYDVLIAALQKNGVQYIRYEQENER
jgi:hypothetical protein